MSGAVFDQKSQYDQIIPWLIGGERLYAVYDLKGGGTGFIAITNKRLMFYDKAFLGKRKALTSVPFNKITAVSSVDEGRGLFGATSELVVKTGSEAFEFEFELVIKRSALTDPSCPRCSRTSPPNRFVSRLASPNT